MKTPYLHVNSTVLRTSLQPPKRERREGWPKRVTKSAQGRHCRLQRNRLPICAVAVSGSILAEALAWALLRLPRSMENRCDRQPRGTDAHGSVTSFFRGVGFHIDLQQRGATCSPKIHAQLMLKIHADLLLSRLGNRCCARCVTRSRDS